MLGKHHFLVYLFFMVAIISGLQFTIDIISANGPAPLLDSTPNGVGDYVIALPVVLGSYSEASEATFDLSIERIEVTQAIQDGANSVPLVSGRQTVVRVYIRSDAQGKLDGIRVSLAGTANGQSLNNSPLVSPLGTVYEVSDRGVYTSTFNFYLPASWLDKSQVTFTAQVDSANAVCETSESNNTLTAAFAFTQVPSFDLVIVPIRYTHIPSGATYGPPGDTISSMIYRLYPVPTMTVSLYQPLSFRGNLILDTGWKDLLEDIANLKTFDNAPESRVYYGLVPTGLGTASWFNGGYAGLGYIGWRASIGLNLEDLKWGQDAGAYIAAHEIGHNLNSLHAPGCGAGNVDPLWPWIGDGHTHEYGLDLGTLRIKMPTSEDIMGYCRDGGFWISSYTYRKLMVDQLARGGATISQQPQEMLYIRATLDEDDTATLRPIYHLIALPSATPTTSDYSVQLLDAKGNEVARYLVEVKTAEGTDFSFRTISALVPLPAETPAEMRLLKGNTLLVQRQLQAAATLQSGLQLANVDNGLRLNWSSGGQPVLVRYTSDNGATWTTLAFDLDASELTIDPSKLARGGYYEVSFADTVVPVRMVSTAK
ncbi:MAG: hypothetical protein ACYCZF_16790 [Anaerolineae bacterium]